jgi:signal transduction histidine kinase/ActR/RegA family two-component response regulator
MLLATTLSILILGSFWIANEFRRFNFQAEILQKDYIETQKALIKREVDRTINYIDYNQAQQSKRIQWAVKHRVEIANKIALELYQQFQGQESDLQIQSRIQEALYPFCMQAGGNSMWIINAMGDYLVNPADPHRQGINIFENSIKTGISLDRQQLELVTQEGEGFFEDRGNHGQVLFLKFFRPFNWLIGDTASIQETEAQLKQEVLGRIAEIRFGTEGYIFVNQYDGKALITNGQIVRQDTSLWELTDPDGIKVIQAERRVAENPEGGFIYYKWRKLTSDQIAPKVSFVRGCPKWQWIVGAGTYLDEIDVVLASHKADLAREVRKQITKILAILAVLLVIALISARNFSATIRKSFDTFQSFFQKNMEEAQTIDSDALHFTEFVTLAESANRMIITRQKIEADKRDLEKELNRSRKMEALGLLAGGVAHDLNNILSGIVSYPEYLLMDLPADSKLRKPIETIHKSGLRAAAVVDDLITLARGVASHKRVLHLNKVIEDYLQSADFNKLKGKHPSIQIDAQLSSELLNIKGSPIHLQKTIMNLITNAFEAIGEAGKVWIKTANCYVDQPMRGYEKVTIGEYVKLSVQDNGPGIAAEDLERIFEPFYTKKRMGRSGTGLGLSVVWNTVQDHEGYIDLYSDAHGSRFDLYFPITRENCEDDPVIQIPMAAFVGHGEKILVVDDEETQREVACSLLNKLGYMATAADSGEKAVDYLKHNPVDLIILDMIMEPGMNGRETYEKILKLHPHQKAIIASGYTLTEEVRRTQELGAGKYIKKPYTLEQLGLAVRNELKRGS